MGSTLSIFSKKPVEEAPAKVPTDIIVPFHTFDSSPYLRTLILNFTYRFDDVLDAEKLRTSLERLLEIGDWRKLGARVRLNVSCRRAPYSKILDLPYVQEQGKAEYHIPERFSAERPGFIFTSETHDQSIHQHPVASRMPRSGTRPAVLNDPYEFQELAEGPDAATKFEDWSKSDRPPLGVHVVTFEDATLLTLSFSHTFIDGVGRQLLLKAWLNVLNGEEHKVPPLLGYQEDPLAALAGRVPANKHVFYDQLLSSWGFVRLILSGMWENFWYPKLASRMIFLPGAFVKKLKDQALADIRTSDDSTDQPFLSEGDVILVWWARLTCLAMGIPPGRQMTLNNAFNFRGVIDQFLPPTSAFIGNAVSSSSTSFTASQLFSLPLGQLALQVRHSLQQQRSQEQVEAYASLLAEREALGKPALFGRPDALGIYWSNW
jgi:hypothetical protein